MKQKRMSGLILSLKEKLPETRISGRMFRKRILKCGNYIYPENGQRFSITPQNLDQFVRTFHEMKRDGIEIPVPKDHSLRVEDNTGYVKEMRRCGDYLEADVEFINDKEAENAQKGGVSVWIPPKFQNAKKSYERPIMHVSLTSYPMIPDLGKFDLVCAVFTPNGEKGQVSMLSPAMQSVMDALTRYMGWEVPESVTNGDDEQAAAFICGLLIGQDTDPDPSGAEAGNTADFGSAENISGGEIPVELVASAIWGRRSQLDNCVRQGRITPAHGATLRQQFARDNMTASQLKKTESAFRGVMLGLNVANGGNVTGNGNFFGSMTGSQQKINNSVWGEVDRRRKDRSLRWNDLNSR